MGGQLDCAMGPDCYYARLVDEGEGAAPGGEGITDAAALEAGRLDRARASGCSSSRA